MKYCEKCGNELVDEAVACTNCGCATTETNRVMQEKTSGYKTAIKILMIIGTVISGFYILPLAWCIPMTVSYSNKIKRSESISLAFKICSLLFVSQIGGILMLCDKD